MSALRDRMLAQTANLTATKDRKLSVPADAPAKPPKTAVGTRGLLEDAHAEIEDLKNQLMSGMAGGAIPVEKVRRNPWQPRIKFNELKLTELAESIKEIGQLQPILVRRVMLPDGEVDFYELIAGERRWRAHKINGMSEIKAVVIEATDEDMAIFALAENISRDDLEDFEISRSMLLAEKEFPSRKRMAEALGLSRGSLHRYLAFGKLPKFMLDDLEENPALLGGNAASAIVAVLQKFEEDETETTRAEALAREFWQQLRAETLEQGKFSVLLEGAMKHSEPAGGRSSAPGSALSAAGSRDIRKVYAGRAQAGSITKDAVSFTVKLKTPMLTPAQEERIRSLIGELFAENGQS